MSNSQKNQPYTWEILDDMLDRGDAQELARKYRFCNPKYIRAQCRQPEGDEDFSTGRLNDLDRILQWIHFRKEMDGKPNRAYPIGRAISSALQGSFVPDLEVPCTTDESVMKQLSSILKETGEAIEETNTAYFINTPGEITSRELQRCTQAIDEALVSLIQLRQLLAAKVGDSK